MNTQTSSVIHQRMIEFLQAELNEANKKLVYSNHIVDAQQAVIQSLKRDYTMATDQLHHVSHGAEIISGANDEMYAKSRELFLTGQIREADWDDYYRIMLRADIGFSILHGADIIDLTADEDIEEIDGEETETEDEESMEESV